MYVLMDGRLVTAEVTKVSSITEIQASNLSKIAGTNLTGRDWSNDFAMLQNLDAPTSTLATQSTLQSINTKLRNINSAQNLDVVDADLTAGGTHNVGVHKSLKAIAFRATAATNVTIKVATDSTYSVTFPLITKTSVTEFVTDYMDVIALRPWRYLSIVVDPAGAAGDVYSLYVRSIL